VPYRRRGRTFLATGVRDNRTVRGRVGLIESTPFYVEGHRLWGTLHHPANARPPCIIGLHGLEGEKDRGKWPVFADRFCEAGYAFLRFNFRGCGMGRERSEGQFEDTTLTGRIRDYEAALRVLGERGGVNGQRVGVVGSSFWGHGRSSGSKQQDTGHGRPRYPPYIIPRRGATPEQRRRADHASVGKTAEGQLCQRLTPTRSAEVRQDGSAPPHPPRE
jgi:hypothetical protein